MEYLKIILYILVFPGLIFSSFMGFFISGLDRKIVAKMQRRRGPKISQSFYDFIKLLGKDTIYNTRVLYNNSKEVIKEKSNEVNKSDLKQDIQTKEKDVGILKSLEEQEALLENVEGEEFKAKIDSLKFIEIT